MLLSALHRGKPALDIVQAGLPGLHTQSRGSQQVHCYGSWVTPSVEFLGLRSSGLTPPNLDPGGWRVKLPGVHWPGKFWSLLPESRPTWDEGSSVCQKLAWNPGFPFLATSSIPIFGFHLPLFLLPFPSVFSLVQAPHVLPGPGRPEAGRRAAPPVPRLVTSRLTGPRRLGRALARPSHSGTSWTEEVGAGA